MRPEEMKRKPESNDNRREEQDFPQSDSEVIQPGAKIIADVFNAPNYKKGIKN
jgi:hypothetical protein